VILALGHLPEPESYHPVPVRLIHLRELHSHRLTDLHVFHSGNNALVSIMITRMLLSLRRASAGSLGQSWDVGGTEGALDPLISPRMLRSVTHFSSSVYRDQVNSVIPIPMETIHTRDKQCRV
jgi:hypothetical protein